jgi:hypothetical protein
MLRRATGPHIQLRSVKKKLDLDSVEGEVGPPVLDAVSVSVAVTITVRSPRAICAV